MEGLAALAEALESANDLLIEDPAQETAGRGKVLQVVALGPSGVGKSAVLNSLLGHPVLPVEKGGATKFAVIVEVAREAGQLRGVLSSKPTSQLVTAGEIRSALGSESKRWLPNITRSANEVVLQLFSPTAPNVRMVDLPGFDKRLPELAVEHGKGDAVLLVLLAAPTAPGVANARVLFAAQELDPEGKRTVGVITSVDEGRSDPRALAAVSKLLAGSGPPLARDIPWVAMLGAPPGEEDMEGQWAAETRVLRSTLPNAPQERLGRQGLLTTLAKLLKGRLKEKIPRIMAGLEGRAAEVESELVRLGEALVQSPEGNRALALELCRTFDAQFIHHMEVGEVGGAKLVALFETGLPQRIKKLPLKDIFKLENLKKTILEADGYQPYLLSPEKGLRALVRIALDLAKQPATMCVDEVHRVLLELVSAAASSTPGLGRFPPLKRELVEVASAALEEYRSEAKTMVTSLINMERSFIPPSHFRRLVQRRVERMRAEEERGGGRSGPRRASESDIRLDGAADSPREEGRLVRAMNSMRSGLGANTPPQKEASPSPSGFVDGQEMMAGFLYKRGSSSSKWQKRWFIVNERTGRLGYLKKPEEKYFRETITLQDAVIKELSEEGEEGGSGKGQLKQSSSGLREDGGRKSQSEADLVLKISHKQAYQTVIKSHYALFLRADNIAEKFRWLAKLRGAARAPRGTENGADPLLVKGGPPAVSTASSATPPSTPSREAPVSSKGPSDPDADMLLIAAEVKDYVDAVLDSLAANIPKAVVLFQVEKAKEAMLAKLYSSLSQQPDGRIEELVKEDASVRLQRERARQQAQTLQKLQRQLSIQQEPASEAPAEAESLSQGGGSAKGPAVVEDWRLAFQSAGTMHEEPEPLTIPSMNRASNAAQRQTPAEMPREDVIENGSLTPTKRANPVRRPPPPPATMNLGRY